MREPRKCVVGIVVVLSACVHQSCTRTCDVEQIGKDLAGKGATDCGQLVIGPGARVGADGGISEGVSCALEAQDAGHAFWLYVVLNAVDVGTTYVFLRTPSGQSLQLSQDYSANFGGSKSAVTQFACGSFASDPSTALACQSPQAQTTVCN